MCADRSCDLCLPSLLVPGRLEAPCHLAPLGAERVWVPLGFFNDFFNYDSINNNFFFDACCCWLGYVNATGTGLAAAAVVVWSRRK